MSDQVSNGMHWGVCVVITLDHFIINLLNNYSIKIVRFYVCFSQYYCCIDEWMKYLHPLEGESLAMYTILQAMLMAFQY